MVISANRFKVKDTDLTSPVMDFLETGSNDNYNARPKPNDTSGPGTSKESKADSETLREVSTASREFLKKVAGKDSKDILDKELDDTFTKVRNNKALPPIVRESAAKAYSTNPRLAKARLKKELSKPPMELCQNTGFLHIYGSNRKGGLDLLEAFMAAVLLSMLDKLCSEILAIRNSAPVKAIENLVGVANGEITPQNALGKLGSVVKSVDVLQNTIPVPSAPDSTSVVDDILSGNSDSAIEAIRASNPDSSTKQSYIEAIELEEEEVIPGSTEHLALLDAKGKIVNLPVTSTTSRESGLVNQHTATNAARDLKGIGDFDTSTLPVTNDPVKKSLYDKLKATSSAVKNNRDLQSRDNTPNEYDDFDFGTIDLSFTSEELEILDQETEEVPPTNHRRSDLPISIEAFLEDL